jgi:hypothetical protein
VVVLLEQRGAMAVRMTRERFALGRGRGSVQRGRSRLRRPRSAKTCCGDGRLDPGDLIACPNDP